jgi:hypothetical protein
LESPVSVEVVMALEVYPAAVGRLGVNVGAMELQTGWRSFGDTAEGQKLVAGEVGEECDGRASNKATYLAEMI